MGYVWKDFTGVLVYAIKQSLWPRQHRCKTVKGAGRLRDYYVQEGWLVSVGFVNNGKKEALHG